MIRHLKYWLETMENIRLLEQLMAENLYMYQRTQDMLYLEYIINNIEEIFRLKLLSEEHYEKTIRFQFPGEVV